VILQRLIWAAVAIASASLIALIWLDSSIVCDVDSAGHEVCRAGPAMGVPGGVLASFFLGLLTVFALVRALRRE